MAIEKVKLVECPRDAMQGIERFIPTETKVELINAILAVGFDTVDFGSFVSPKAIPQMRDTAQVLAKLDLERTNSKLLAIVVNARGARDAAVFDEIEYLGFPFSVSETFQQRNANSSIEESLGRVEEIQAICQANKKKLVVYLSMAFGNPYNDPWDSEIVTAWGSRLANDFGVTILAPSDTIGTSSPENITGIFSTMISELPNVEIGAHLHTTPTTWREKVEAVLAAGCTRIDGALRGFGGCPMAKDELTGNMPTENVVGLLDEMGLSHGLDASALNRSLTKAAEVLG